MFCHFRQKFENSKRPPFLGREIFLKIAKSTFLRYRVGRKFRQNRSISHGLGDMSTFAFFSIQNSQLLIYLINYSLIYEAITPMADGGKSKNNMSTPQWVDINTKRIMKRECIHTRWNPVITEKMNIF